MKSIIVIFLLVPHFLLGQSIQNGWVVEMNSGNMPVAGVAVAVVGAIPTDTNGDGYFQLVFAKIKPGSHIVVHSIHKDGYELVNQLDVTNWTLSPQPFRIVLCKNGTLDASRRKFYNIGQDRYHSLYVQTLNDLNNERVKNQLTQEQYEIASEKTTKEYEASMSLLAFYADKFARINKDDLNELDLKALTLAEAGNIEDAIKVYEDAGMLDQFKKKITQRDTALHNIDILSAGLLKEIDLLKKKKDHITVQKIDSIFSILVTYDHSNFEYLFPYAMFALENNQLEKTFTLFKQSLLYCKSENEQTRVLNALDSLYSKIDDTHKVEIYKDEIKQLSIELEQKKEIENLKIKEL